MEMMWVSLKVKNMKMLNKELLWRHRNIPVQGEETKERKKYVWAGTRGATVVENNIKESDIHVDCAS